MKAVIFARVSSKEQEEGHSLEAQTNQALEYAIANNMQIVKQFKIIESSTKGKRPEFAQMISFIKQSKDKIVVLAYNTDRLQRDFDKQSLELKELVNKNKAEIHFTRTKQKITHNADSSTKFRYGLDVLLANDYANRISDNVKRSIKKKLDEGTILNNSPLGYINKPRIDKKKEKVQVLIDKEKSHLVQEIFALYATGRHSMNDIMHYMNNKGLRSKKGNKLSKSVIEGILKNPFYCGYIRNNGLLYKHIHPKLITKELFDTCQSVIKGKRRQLRYRTKKEFTLRGLLSCKHCSCTYSPEIKKGKYVYMRPTKSKGACPYCKHTSEKKIFEQIEKVIQSISIPESVLHELQDELRSSSNNEYKHQKQEIKKLQESYNKVNARLKKARTLLLDEIISQEDYKEAVEDLEVERQNTEVKLKHLRTADESFNKNLLNIFELLVNANNLFKSSENAQKREIIKILFPNLQMNGYKLEFSLQKPFDLFINLGVSQEWLRQQDSNLRHKD